MKFLKSLPAKLLYGIVIGAIAGILLANGVRAEQAWATVVMQVIVSLKNVMGQLITFIVPLIVIGFIAPSITKLGTSATRMLTVALVVAYSSSLLAALLSMGAGYALIPAMFAGTSAEVAGLLEVPADIFGLAIPQIMPVMSALVFAVLIGLAAVWTKAKVITSLLNEFQKIVLDIVSKVVIPILPFFIAGTFCILGFDGTITVHAPKFLLAVVIVLAGHFLWMAILYLVAGAYSGKKASEVFKHYGPAYITAVGTMSSAATLSVALECANKSKALRKDMIGFGIPLFANIHLCGSVLTETFFVMLVHKVLVGTLPSVGTMVLFCVLLGIFAIGAPGVPGGTVMASLGIVTSVAFGAYPALAVEATGLLLAIFAIQDSFGTACNVTGDGALTLMLTGYAEKHGVKEEPIQTVEL